jgi:hypothetical protein
VINVVKTKILIKRFIVTSCVEFLIQSMLGTK